MSNNIRKSTNEQGKVSGSVLTQPRKVLTKPSMYKVLLVNDDFTPMDFVIQILQKVFHKSHDEAVQTMLQVHHSGFGLCGTYTKDVAETKVDAVADFARKNQHPLKCTIEEVNK